MELEELIIIRDAANAAIRSKRALDRCHESYIQRTNSIGFSRAATTTYNANAGHKAASFKADIKHIKLLFKQHIETE